MEDPEEGLRVAQPDPDTPLRRGLDHVLCGQLALEMPPLTPISGTAWDFP